MSKLGGGGGGGGGAQRSGVVTFILNTSGIGYYILHDNIDNLQFWGGSAPLIKKWGGSSPPPPGSLPLPLLKLGRGYKGYVYAHTCGRAHILTGRGFKTRARREMLPPLQNPRSATINHYSGTSHNGPSHERTTSL